MPCFRVHELRHTAASLLLAQDVPFKVVSEVLGHSQIGLTADLYDHVYDEGRAAAAVEMEISLDRLSPPPPINTVDDMMDGHREP